MKKVIIPSSGDLDQVTVYIENFEPGKGQITILCYGSAWTAYWGAMGEESLEEFFVTATADYLFNRLICREWQKETKRHERYLGRIIEAVRKALRTAEGGCATQSTSTAEVAAE